MREDQIVVDHRPDLLIREQRQLVHLVRGAKAVEEMDERDARFEGRGLGDQGEIVRFLDRAGGELGEPGRPHRHDVGMVAEDREALGGKRARGDVEHRGRQLARDLEHVGDHQEEALRGREGRGQRAGLERAVDRARRARPRSASPYVGDVAPDVGLALARPLIGQLGHRRGRRDRVDGADLVDPIGDVGRGLIAVDRHLLAARSRGRSAPRRLAGGRPLSLGSQDVAITRAPGSSRWRGRGIARSRSRSPCRGRSRNDSACPARA